MPFTKAKNYKRFNVGEYMRRKRLDSLAIEKSNRRAKNTALKLARLDEKVRNVHIFCDHHDGLGYFKFKCF